MAQVGGTVAPHGGAPAGDAHLACLAERCAAAAAALAAGGGSLEELGAAADALDTALDRYPGTGAGAPTGHVRRARDEAGDLVASLCAAGLDPVDRRALAEALCHVLTPVAARLRAGA